GVSFLSLQHTALDFIYKGFNVLLFKDLLELQNRREQVDRVFSDFSEELTDPILENEFVYTNTSGEEFRRVFWQVLLHVFNHQTHHRGQISQILDSHGVEHDFSNLNALLS
ncbi:MAG TPA: DinB family protein, partial [Spirochaetia bacterium]|nr:DinB family protein [Spirochaetia bacterium]